MTRDQQPWLHDLVVTLDGPITVVAEQSGDLGPTGTGIVADDRRAVSVSRLLLDDVACVPVTSTAIGARSQHWGVARHLGDPGPDPTVEVVRTRSIAGRGVTEKITVRSRSAEPIATTLSVITGGDAAEIGAIKSGKASGPLLRASPSAPWGWADEQHRTSLDTAPVASASRLEPDGSLRLDWPLVLGPAGSQTVALTWTIERTAPTAFDCEAGSEAADWDPDSVAAASSGSVAELLRIGLTDLRHLLLRDPLAPDDICAAAGTPWYLTLFGRDSIWTARMMASISPALMIGTLRSLARRQADLADPHIAAEPGKILHEIRRNPQASAGLGLPPIYYGTVDATSLWVCLLVDAWRSGVGIDLVTDLLPALDAALDWMRAASAASPDGLIRYADESSQGLANQGWKDSADALRNADGSIAASPIALVEAQAYAVEAALGAAELNTALGRTDDGLVEWAEALAERVRRRFWIGSGPDAFLAMGVDGEGRPIDGVGSNMGHALGTGLLSPDESAHVVERLMRPDMLRDFGIGTLSSDNPGYNPIGYHTGSVWAHDTAIIARGMQRAGFHDEATVVARRLVRLGQTGGFRLPELCGGEALDGRPIAYPASCRPQAWAAASAVVVRDIVDGEPNALVP